MTSEDLNECLKSQGCKLIKELGAGSYGKVYSAEKASALASALASADLAIKISPCEKDSKTQYQPELDILSNKTLSREFIVGYYSTCYVSSANVLYQCIQMELCWKSLTTVFTDHRNVLKSQHPPRFYQHVFPQILQGLHAIHSLGWVHRDIHLGNILILRPGLAKMRDIRIKIADFGNARDIRSIMEKDGTETVSCASSFALPYGAPEEGTGRYNYKVDIFSAGIALCRIGCCDWRRESSAPRDFIHKDDDILLDFIEKLTKTNAKERPSAEEALISIWKDKKVHVKRGDKTADCLTTDNTLLSLRAAIESSTEEPIQSQERLFQKKITANEAKLVPLKSVDDVKRMFQEAKEVSIMVIKKGSASSQAL